MARKRTDPNEMLSREAVAELLGIKVGTLDTFKLRGIVPPPDGKLGRSPWWRRSTIEAWDAARPKAEFNRVNS